MSHFLSVEDGVLEGNRYYWKITNEIPVGYCEAYMDFELHNVSWKGAASLLSGTLNVLCKVHANSEELFYVRVGIIGDHQKELAVVKAKQKFEDKFIFAVTPLIEHTELQSFMLTNKLLYLFIEINSKLEEFAHARMIKVVKRKFEIDYEELLLDGKNSDMVIEVKHRKFKCHRIILGARSPVFAAMMEHEMKEKKTGIVTIEGANPSTFQEFLLYIYTGRGDYVNMDNVTDLYKLGDKYGLEDLKGVCLLLMKDNIMNENFFEIFHLSQMHSDIDLTNAAVDFFLKNFNEIIIKKKWLAFLSENPVESNVLITVLAKNTKRAANLKHHE